MAIQEKKRTKHFLLIIGLIFGVFLYFNLKDADWGTKTAIDKVEIENQKLIPLFNAALAKEIAMYESGWYSGCLRSSYIQVENLFTTIKEISTYSRYGLNSKQSHNRVLVRVEYNNGRKVQDLYTDVSWNGTNSLGDPILLKYVFENGKLVKAFSNGIEREGSPTLTKGPIDDIINAIIHQDYKDHASFYFPPEKSKNDFKKEWDNIK
jgi:hypothetical protein